MLKIIKLFIFVFLLTSSLANAKSKAKGFFDIGIKNYSEKKFKDARESFLKTTELSPNSVNNLYNLGLTEYKLGSTGRAAAYWRRALYLDPRHKKTRNALESISKSLPRSYRSSSWEKFRHFILNHLSLNHIFILFTLFFVGASGSCIKYFTRRYIAQKSHFPMPDLSKITLFFAFGFSLFVILLVTKTYDSLYPRATIISNSASLYLSPNLEDIKIFVIDQGSELIIKKKTNSWAKVYTTAGDIGWVELKNLYQTSGDLNL